jgi:flagellar protein FlaG
VNFAPIVDRTYSTAASASTAVPARASKLAARHEVDIALPTATVDPQHLQAAVDAANKFLAPVARNLQFSIDQDSGKTIVKVIDTETDKVVRQIPCEEMLAISRALGKLKGVMVEQKA